MHHTQSTADSANTIRAETGSAEQSTAEPTRLESELLWFLFLLFVAPFAATGPANASAETTLDRASFEKAVGAVFSARGVSGGFVLYDEDTDVFYRFNESRVRTQTIPASTFKILNSLIFLEEAIIESADATIEWDGREREYPSWNQDQTLESAFRRSAVWVYQALARTAGLNRIQTHVNAVGYGNGQLGSSPDSFWLEGPLKISPEEQIHFLRRLHSGDLPFRPDVMDTVRSMMIDERDEHHILRGKTGWAIRIDPDVGWYVGYLETTNNVHFFALSVDILPDGRGRDRKRIVKDIFVRLGLLSS